MFTPPWLPIENLVLNGEVSHLFNDYGWSSQDPTIQNRLYFFQISIGLYSSPCNSRSATFCSVSPHCISCRGPAQTDIQIAKEPRKAEGQEFESANNGSFPNANPNCKSVNSPYLTSIDIFACLLGGWQWHPPSPPGTRSGLSAPTNSVDEYGLAYSLRIFQQKGSDSAVVS